MPDSAERLLSTLARERSLSLPDYARLIREFSPALAEQAAQMAREARRRVYGDKVFVRGLIEISNVCKNDCLYCGIRRSNTRCLRYTLSPDQIMACCRQGYALGFRTFVLQGGESGVYAVADICKLVRQIKTAFPDCAVTLSLGEYPEDAYRQMRLAGADRYLLRHETADSDHYALLHPPGMTLAARMDCLNSLKRLGFQTGCGFMVGSPGQTVETLAQDLKFIEGFAPEMCGIGPFIPHHDTVFAEHAPGSVALTCFLLSLLRLMHPNLLLPATTALGSLAPQGREQGILAGANVVMPNLSPVDERAKYAIYDNKLASGAESAENLDILSTAIKQAGCQMSLDRADHIPL